MKNKKESQEVDKYGQITFGEETKLLIDIIGQSVILNFMSKKRRDLYNSYKRELERMYKGEMPYHIFTKLQGYCDKFFKEEIEDKYKVSPLVMKSLKANLESIIWDFSLFAESNIILDKSKNEIALYLLQGQAFHYIKDDSSEEDPLSSLPMNVFKTSEEKILVFLTDSYKKVFDDIMCLFETKEKKDFCEEINKLGIVDKRNIHDWQNEKVYNPNWQTLVPVLDYLRKQKYIDIAFVHRLIGLYLRKNAQKAFADILDVSEDELKEIIEKIVKMINKKEERPEEIRSDLYFDDIWFNGQRKKIVKCLDLQNNYENNTDVQESISLIEYLKRNYFRSSEEKFLCLWLQVRAKVFEKYGDLKDNKELQSDIIKDYRKSFDELLNNTQKSPFLTQFLVEIMLINDIFYPRRVKVINDYYKYGFTLDVFRPNMKKNILSRIKEFRDADIRKSLVCIHSKFCPIKISP